MDIKEYQQKKKDPQGYKERKDREALLEGIRQATQELGTTVMKAVKNIPVPETPETPEPIESVQVSNLPDVQRVEVTNFPEQKAPQITVQASEVRVEPTPVTVKPADVNIDTQGVIDEVASLNETTKEIKQILSIKEEFEPVQIFDKNGKPLDWEHLIRAISSGGRSSPGLTTAIQNTTSDILAAITANYTTRIDDTSTTSVTYIGIAALNASEGSAVWRIKKIDESSPTNASITWADGNDNFDNVWTNRTSLTFA